jgi:hypothetical protein
MRVRHSTARDFDDQFYDAVLALLGAGLCGEGCPSELFVCGCDGAPCFVAYFPCGSFGFVELASVCGIAVTADVGSSFRGEGCFPLESE